MWHWEYVAGVVVSFAEGVTTAGVVGTTFPGTGSSNERQARVKSTKNRKKYFLFVCSFPWVFGWDDLPGSFSNNTTGVHIFPSVYEQNMDDFVSNGGVELTRSYLPGFHVSFRLVYPAC